MTKKRACFNCELGTLYHGTYGWYCLDCHTYEPDDETGILVDELQAYKDEEQNIFQDLREHIPDDTRKYLERKWRTQVATKIVEIEDTLQKKKWSTIASITASLAGGGDGA